MEKQKCRYKKFVRNEKGHLVLVEGKTDDYQFDWVDGTLLEFGIDVIETETSVGSYSTGIIQLRDGNLVNAPVEDIQIVNDEMREGESTQQDQLKLMNYEISSEDNNQSLTICPHFREKMVGSEECQKCAFYAGHPAYASQTIYCRHEHAGHEKF
jgi:hypothetical protein